MKDTGTHLPLLMKLINITDGAVIELGSGYCSTSFLHNICKDQDRKFISYENNLDWVDKMDSLTTYIEDWDDIVLEPHYSIVFLDHHPTLRRKIDALRFKDVADYIVLHDSEESKSKWYAYHEIYNEFKYRKEYTKLIPHTLILSNLKDLSQL